MRPAPDLECHREFNPGLERRADIDPEGQPEITCYLHFALSHLRAESPAAQSTGLQPCVAIKETRGLKGRQNVRQIKGKILEPGVERNGTPGSRPTPFAPGGGRDDCNLTCLTPQ
jgi:hypothetical protein